MRVAYLSSSYVPSRRASSVQVMKMCAAFSRAGHEVHLATKRNLSRQEVDVLDDFAFYGVAEDFELTKIKRPAAPGGGLVYGTGLSRFLRASRSRFDLAYCRDLYGSWLATRLSIPTVFEAHEPLPGPAQRMLLRLVLRPESFKRLVAISQALAEDYSRLYPELAGADLLIAHDGADPVPGSEDSATPDRAERDTMVKFRVGYVGQLYRGKGLEILVPLAGLLPNTEFQIVGGTRETLAHLSGRDLPPNLRFCGFQPPGRMTGLYDSFDAVVMPYQPQVAVAGGRSDAGRWMSPLKMFEYMAAGKPIVSSDLPVLREVLEDGKNALLVPPDDLEAWAEAIRRLQRSADLRDELGSAARHDLLANYTWDLRAKNVLSGLDQARP
ncbi:MAG: glycosyltransferase family 4 protein [bacterium]|nr:glycosyltransferase family 4 protein [bacterium]